MNWTGFFENVKSYFSSIQLLIFKHKFKLKKYFKFSTFLVLTLICLLTIIQLGIFFSKKQSINYDIDQLKSNLSKNGNYESIKQKVTILDKNSSVIGIYNPSASPTLSLKQCSQAKIFQETLVSSEDRDFYTHYGISIKGILRAIYQNVIKFQLHQGGGSITQQLARNLFTDKQRYSINRKIYETIIAFYLESKLSKNEILCAYMNKAYFGQSIYGIDEASRYYFSKSASKLTYPEAALLVGVLPAPSLYNPIRNARASFVKQKYVMSLLVDNEKISEKDSLKGMNEFRVFYNIKESDVESSYGTIARDGSNRLFQTNLAPEVNEYVLKYLGETIEGFHKQSGSFTVRTTIDASKQRISKSTLSPDIEALRWSFRNESKLAYQDSKDYATQIQGVIVSMRPSDGEILAISGGAANSDSYRNMVRSFYMKRQVGSALKGFLYCVALEEDVIDANTELIDEPINISGYSPKNWNGKYLGKISIAQALQQSVNTVAVATLKKLGIGTYINYISKALSLESSERKRIPKDLTLALGSADFSPIEVAILYSEIVNGGKIIDHSIIRKIEFNDEVIFENKGFNFSSGKIFSSDNTSRIISFMRTVFESGGTASWIGDKKKRNSNFLNFDIAGKSGTVESDNATFRKLKIKGSRDIWFVGLTPKEVTVVWFGHDEGVPIPGSGSSVAASTWAKYAQSAIISNENDNHFDLVSSPIEEDLIKLNIFNEETEEQKEEKLPEGKDQMKDKDEEGSSDEKIYIAPDEKPKG